MNLKFTNYSSSCGSWDPFASLNHIQKNCTSCIFVNLIYVFSQESEPLATEKGAPPAILIVERADLNSVIAKFEVLNIKLPIG